MSDGQTVIAGVVRDAAGRPVPEARVDIVAGPGPFPDIAALTDAGGGFALAAPAPGTYEIEAAADGFRPTRESVAVAPGRPARVVLVLSR